MMYETTTFTFSVTLFKISLMAMLYYDDDNLLRATRVPNFDPLPVITLMVAPFSFQHWKFTTFKQHNDSLICVEGTF